MGTQKRPDLAMTSRVPGPGNYSFRTTMGDGPKIGLSSRLSQPKARVAVPGPGAYQPMPDVLVNKMPSAGIGYGSRGELRGKSIVNVPGPGTYPAQEKLREGPKFGFGTSKRAGNKAAPNPGPGNYSIPTMFASLPPYERSKSKIAA